MKKPLIIAEVKTKSPFGFVSEKSWEDLFTMADQYGDIISIHTDPRWGGSFDLLERAVSMTKKPILAKGIHASDDDIVEALKRGATSILVVGRIPSVHLDRCLLEPNTLEELAALPSDCCAVWNARDLSSGSPKEATFAQARAIFPGWLCQASHVSSVDDIDPSADAVLVGERLASFVETLA